MFIGLLAIAGFVYLVSTGHWIIACLAVLVLCGN